MTKTIEELEQFVRSGQFDEAAERLAKLKNIPRKDVGPIANIARRINQPALAIRILHPLVRSSNKLAKPVTPLEKIEYAEALRRVGAIDEAWKLLSETDAEDLPQAVLYKVFCLFNQWRYEEAIPVLRMYVQRPDLDSYARDVGIVNLAAALVQTENLKEAKELLLEFQSRHQKSEKRLLYGNSLELSAQILVYEKNYDAAIDVLLEAKEVLKQSGALFSLFPEKWTAIAHSLRLERVTPELRGVLVKAQEMKHWETVRDCDTYIALLERNWGHLERVYFGTPFENFRQRVMSLAGAHVNSSKPFIDSLSSRPPVLLDIASGRLLGTKSARMPTGQALHRFFILITKDLYRPLLALSAFGQLFPDEFMNDVSANRVHQIVKRCRLWIKENELDLKIEELDGGYRLVLGNDIGLILPNHSLPLETKELEWLLIEKEFGSTPFKIHEVNDLLESSASRTQRLLRWAIETGRISKEGKGSATFYKLVLPRTKV